MATSRSRPPLGGRWALLALAALGCVGSSTPSTSDVSTATANDNRVAAGRIANGVRVVSLVVRRTRWAPGRDSTQHIDVEAFGEVGRAPSIPAPLLRTSRGKPIRLVVRNALADTLVLCGFAGRICARNDTLRVAPESSATIDLRNDPPGTYLYWGGVVRGGRTVRRGTGGQLVGAYVVDSSDAHAADRVLVMTAWNGTRPAAVGSDTPFVQAINGRTWPATERLSYEVGDTARWRVLSATDVDHPMHLHGFYFRVDAKGDVRRDTTYAPDARRSVVTENLPPMTTIAMTWVPTRSGHWLFHCHRAAHMSALQQYHLAGRAMPPLRDLDPPAGSVANAEHQNHAITGMGGLIVGIEVRGYGEAKPAADESARTLRLLVQQRARRYGPQPGFGYVLQDGARVPAVDSIAIPGAPIVLRRGERVAVTIVNRLTRPTAVHWHGIELESFYDGVAGWSGGADGSVATTPLIAPGDSFVARFTPPRAGTFIYHTHANEQYQLSSGLYGALVVLEPGERWNPATDHVLVFSQDGPSDTAPIALNGGTPPAAIPMRAGVPHRIRLVNIIPQDMASLELRRDGQTLRWTPLAKDGATLPVHQRAEQSAKLYFGPGETYDFTFVPRAGRSELVTRSFNDFTTVIRGY